MSTGIERRVERLETRRLNISLGARPPWIPEGDAASWPDETIAGLDGFLVEARSHSITRPLAWMKLADLLALQDRLGPDTSPAEVGP